MTLWHRLKSFTQQLILCNLTFLLAWFKSLVISCRYGLVAALTRWIRISLPRVHIDLLRSQIILEDTRAIHGCLFRKGSLSVQRVEVFERLAGCFRAEQID
jgi:hypothetical protein